MTSDTTGLASNFVLQGLMGQNNTQKSVLNNLTENNNNNNNLNLSFISEGNILNQLADNGNLKLNSQNDGNNFPNTNINNANTSSLFAAAGANQSNNNNRISSGLIQSQYHCPTNHQNSLHSTHHQIGLSSMHSMGPSTAATHNMIFVCPVPGCGKTFRRKAYVKKHMELHSNHKAYGCDLCNVRCRQYAGLYIHYKGVHKKKLRKNNVRYYRTENDTTFTSLDRHHDVGILGEVEGK